MTAVHAGTGDQSFIQLLFSGSDSWGCICARLAGWREGRWDTRPASPRSNVETTTWAWLSTKIQWSRAASMTPTATGSKVLQQYYVLRQRNIHPADRSAEIILRVLLFNSFRFNLLGLWIQFYRTQCEVLKLEPKNSIRAKYYIIIYILFFTTICT